jgi:hypothetical protein
MTSRIGLIAASPLLISAAQATEHLAVDLDTAAHYVSAANGACGPHDLDRAVDAVEFHQPTVAPHLKGFVVLVAAYFANRHDTSLKKRSAHHVACSLSKLRQHRMTIEIYHFGLARVDIDDRCTAVE